MRWASTVQEQDVAERDPVCGKPVDRANERLRSEYADVEYHFCSQTCMDRFTEQPDIFTAKPGLGQVAERDRAQRPDEHLGELKPGQQIGQDHSPPAPDPG
ncbi:MAG: YHS domain-containing protein [Chloroflexi bacterium]|nr:YHS domain-containing protein [Chloroflexota bacterium]